MTNLNSYLVHPYVFHMTPTQLPKPRDTVTNISPQPKHTAKQMYLVTLSSPNQITTQRILHPLSQGQTKLMSTEYVSEPKHVRVVYHPPHSTMQLEPDPYLQQAPA